MQNQYVQYYGPKANGNNYTSPLLHTIKLTGLKPKTEYFYQCAVSADHLHDDTHPMSTASSVSC